MNLLIHTAAGLLLGTGALPTYWVGLAPGTHAAGWKRLIVTDTTRSWKSPVDLDGKPTTGSLYRPIEITLFYPAEPNTGSLKTVNEFQNHTGSPQFEQLSSALNRRDAAAFQSLFKSKTSCEVAGHQTMFASKDAKAVSQRFPIVLYSMGLNDYSSSNLALWEYLASHGYIVATVAQLGKTPTSLDLGIGTADIETQVRDLEFCSSTVRDKMHLDIGKVAAIGHSYGGISALLLASRNLNINAVVGLDASYGVEQYWNVLTSHPMFRQATLTMPWLDIRRENPEFTRKPLESASYSERILVRMTDMSH